MGNLTPEQTGALATELVQLWNQQNEALENAAFVGMTPEQLEAYEARQTRMSEIRNILQIRYTPGPQN
jgi:hypothetical protein